MAQYQITVDRQLLQQLFRGNSQAAGVAGLAGIAPPSGAAAACLKTPDAIY
ncbi:hypothetical protein [Brevibacillus marinus]|uniref:hypothetical protein n=1 Tax=Brevibacillus marinus TaxID=2496837 RepID=UPI0013E09AFD|nr:hypothetical protein [Brevibacillus marinus]